MRPHQTVIGSHNVRMGATRGQAVGVIGATVVVTAGALIYIFATVPPRSVAIEEAVRAAAGSTITETVTVTLAAPAPLVQTPVPVETTPAPAPAPVPLVETPAPAPAPPEVVNPGSFCSDSGAPGVTEDGTPMVCTTTAEDDRNRWRSAA
jgi:hypothetical protein